MRKNKIQMLSPLIFMMVFATGLFQTNLLEAAISSTGYDFGPVEVESTKTTAISITNLEDTSTTITGFVFANTDCSDFSVVSTPESMIIPSNGTIEVVVGFTPSTIGTCSDTLRIYAGSPLPYSVTLTGTGIEAKSEQPEPFDVSRPYLTQIKEIKSFMQTNVKNGDLQGAGKGRGADKRLKVLNKMLIITSHLIENGYLEAARNNLIAIYKKTDGKANPKDFVEGEAKEEFASKIQHIIKTLSFN
jgi:hypothetical protein